ncbi:protein fuzzy homolog [Diachasmimorpha longicaudata]|uniref:protein fuzzy homolog n=1 Tax=Diachasmimorpha longicaudata TaxID=58733 RepID=UPI0030B8DF30
MTAHVMCLTSSGGIPLFSRKRGEGSVMTFSKMASLSGIHMFLKSQDIKLKTTEMPDTTVVWKEFADSITLIAIASGTTKTVLENFIHAVFNAMILVAGIDEIKSSRNIERLKKELRNCNNMIDKLLDCLDIGNRSCSEIDLVTMSSSILCPENYFLHSSLEMLMEYLDSTYGCILIHGCMAVGTDSWLQLDPIEKKLLMMAGSMDSTCSTCDLPVFLPKMSPNVAFRLISVTLIKGIQVLALCGPRPDLIEVEKTVIQHWRNNVDTLRAAEQAYPQCFPADLSLDPSILGFLLVDCNIGKFVMGRNSNIQSTNQQMGTQRLDILKTFYYQAVEPFLFPRKNETPAGEKKPSDCKMIQARETYWCSEYHKCHAFRERDNILCILYPYSIPTYTIRLITQKTLKILISDKQTCW